LKFLKTPLLMNTNKAQRQKYTLMKRYDKVWTQIKAKTKTKSSSGKRRTPGEIIRMKNGVFLANENECRDPGSKLYRYVMCISHTSNEWYWGYQSHAGIPSVGRPELNIGSTHLEAPWN
jgi:hypothetical protein